MAIKFDTTDLDRITEIFERRESVVPDAITDGQEKAQAFAAAGGRQRKKPTRYGYLRHSDRVHRIRRATGNEVARMAEHSLYHKFIDWFGSW